MNMHFHFQRGIYQMCFAHFGPYAFFVTRRDQLHISCESYNLKSPLYLSTLTRCSFSSCTTRRRPPTGVLHFISLKNRLTFTNSGNRINGKHCFTTRTTCTSLISQQCEFDIFNGFLRGNTQYGRFNIETGLE